MSGNPIFEGWYADPEGVVFGHECWIYPTWSQRYKEQLFMDAYSSKDLVHWTKHEKVISQENISSIISNSSLYGAACMEISSPSLSTRDG